MFVFKAGVVGAGIMGGEIAHVIANAGVPVVLKDVDQKYVDVGLDKARSLWQAQVDAGKLDADGLEAKLGLITGTTSYDAFGDVDFVIEAVPESIDLKQRVFSELDAVTPGHAVLASNTSALSISEISDATLRADKVVGFHFFYPASVMKLIEVAEGEATSDDTLRTAVTFAQTIKKVAINCGDSPGFVVNRVLMSTMSEMFRHQEEAGISFEELDALVTEAKAAPVGPAYLADLLGLDTVLHVANYMQQCYGDQRFHVPAKLRELVAAGDLGRKTGKGFYGERQ